MQYDIIKLKFKGPIHLSKGNAADDSGELIWHSDAIKAALFAAGIDTGLAVDKGQNSQNEQNICPFLDSFLVSSAFPYFDIGPNATEYFFPKPASGLHAIEDIPELNPVKTTKKIEFIGKSFFEEILTGKQGSRVIEKKQLLWNKQFVSDQASTLKDYPYLYVKEENMRVSVPRIVLNNDNATPYLMERIHFHQDAGLFFFIHLQNDDYRDLINDCLEALSENGIGADRSTGNGGFSFSQMNFDLANATPAKRACLLSLYCPDSHTELSHIDLNASAYELTKRGGYIANAANIGQHTMFRKKSIYMFKEGAILANNGNAIIGQLADLQPDIMQQAHPVWRDGRAFVIPML